MTPEAPAKAKLSNSVEPFILLFSLLSLLNMAALLLPWMAPATVKLLEIFDLGLRMKRAASPRACFIRGRGWLDLLGSVPLRSSASSGPSWPRCITS